MFKLVRIQSEKLLNTKGFLSRSTISIHEALFYSQVPRIGADTIATPVPLVVNINKYKASVSK